MQNYEITLTDQRTRLSTVLLDRYTVPQLVTDTTNILWNSKIRHHVRNSPAPIPVLSQINPVHATILYLEDHL